MNTLAMAITIKEGKKVPLNIGQVKEVLSCLRDAFQENPTEVGQCLLTYFGKAPKERR